MFLIKCEKQSLKAIERRKAVDRALIASVRCSDLQVGQSHKNRYKHKLAPEFGSEAYEATSSPQSECSQARQHCSFCETCLPQPTTINLLLRWPGRSPDGPVSNFLCQCNLVSLLAQSRLLPARHVSKSTRHSPQHLF